MCNMHKDLISKEYIYFSQKQLPETITRALYNNWGGGGPTPFLPMEKCVFSHFSPWGKMGKKVYGKKGKSIHFPLFPYTFFPFFPMGKNGVGPPPITKRVVNLRGSCFCEKYSKKTWDTSHIKTALVYHTDYHKSLFFCRVKNSNQRNSITMKMQLA